MFLLAAILLLVFVVPWKWGAALIVSAAIIEVGQTWFWLRWTRRGRPKVGAEAMVGERGEVTEDGWVRVHGELWRARGTALEPGRTVRVTGVDGLTLIVE